ncbi:gas vesicle protein GvpG [Nonomuraea sp. NPDC049784]|uniref:gas vesicle protein GvpG n=1 Tax=unclassified Nonomuraea TaxID=2593643 RepID=UPI0034054B1B
MGLLGLIFGWPLAPFRGLLWLAELFQEQVEMETRNPASVRRHLEEIEAAREAGEITEEEESQAVERVLQLMAAGRR